MAEATTVIKIFKLFTIKSADAPKRTCPQKTIFINSKIVQLRLYQTLFNTKIDNIVFLCCQGKKKQPAKNNTQNDWSSSQNYGGLV